MHWLSPTFFHIFYCVLHPGTKWDFIEMMHFIMNLYKIANNTEDLYSFKNHLQVQIAQQVQIVTPIGLKTQH